MSQIKFTYSKLTAVFACAAIAFFQLHHSVNGTRVLANAPLADLTAERQTLNSYVSDLGTFEKKVAELQLRSSITSTELNSTKTSASTLKSKVTNIQQAFQSAINKLKASREWESFDEVTLKQFGSNTKLITLIQNAGGPRKMLEAAATQLSGLSLEIDSLVQPLNTKVASNGFTFGNGAKMGFMSARTSFTRPSVLLKESLRCRLRTAIYYLQPPAPTGFPTNTDAFNKMMCACFGDECAAI